MRHKHATKEGLPPRRADSESADQGGRGSGVAPPAEARPVNTPPKNFSGSDEDLNYFGRLLELMGEHELRMYSRRARRLLVREEMQRLHEILEDEIAERRMKV